ncbi:UDP-glycosyltransferase 83A1, partial [Mucuna pruriens]
MEDHCCVPAGVGHPCMRSTSHTSLILSLIATNKPNPYLKVSERKKSFLLQRSIQSRHISSVPIDREMGILHFLAISFPILGHMNPLLQFSNVLSKYVCKITFLSSDENYYKLKSASGGHGKDTESHIKLVSLPDGVDPEDDRKDQAKVIATTINTMRSKLPKLIEDINALDSDNKISCIIVTKNMGWALEVGSELGIKGALFWPASATSLASFNSIHRILGLVGNAT